ncbi:MAG: thermonuclease family protein [Pseudooceanicola sp.]
MDDRRTMDLAGRRARRARRRAQWMFIALALPVIAYAFTSERVDLSAPERAAPRATIPVLRGGDAWTSRGTLPPAAGAHLRGPVTHVRDGDTIEVAGVPVRIANLDCAERGTAAGRRATARMRGLVSGQRLTCDLEGRMSEDREVGVCALPGGQDIGAVMIRDGYCGRWQG